MFEVDEMEGCHSCEYGDEFDTDKEPCKYCYGLSLYTKKETKMRAIVTIIDEKTGHVFEKDKILEPYREQRDPRFCSTEYEYRFRHSVLDDYFKRIFDQQIEPNEELLREIGMKGDKDESNDHIL